ncbi:MAG: 4'-phosphopantetheinyl transferase superfamily protein [Chlorobi bacterium]|nr:4'-phosphopantetheinyl transferase superfamily protein [Chlorobiota bacterium]
MTVIFEKTNAHCTLKLAEFEEEADILREKIKNDLQPEELKYYENIKNKKRKKEWLGTRILLKEILGYYEPVKYDSSGNPFLDGNMQISITHSGNLVGITINKKNEETGIDTEIISDRILRTSHKFISEKELAELNSDKNKLEKIYLHWCGKEVLFKIKGDGGYDFKKDFFVIIPKIPKNQGTVKAYIGKNESYRLNYKFINSGKNKIILVWKS